MKWPWSKLLVGAIITMLVISNTALSFVISNDQHEMASLHKERSLAELENTRLASEKAKLASELEATQHKLAIALSPAVYTQANLYHYDDRIVVIFVHFTPNATATVSLHMPAAGISLGTGTRIDGNGVGSVTIYLGRNLPKYNAPAYVQVKDAFGVSVQIQVYLVFA
jgi:hypothetical protein